VEWITGGIAITRRARETSLACSARADGIHLAGGGVSATALLAGYAADVAIGDPRRWHPVAGFGTVATALERASYEPTRRRGALVAGALVGGAAILAELLSRAAGRVAHGRGIALAAVTWAALGGRSLRREALHVANSIDQGDLRQARAALSALCGRDADELDIHGLSRAVVESVAENTSDAVVGALAWGTIGGPAGVAAYRAANTLDAMFGHRSDRYASFGYAAAKLDDAMNWPAARLSGAITCLAAPLVGGSPTTTLAVLRRDGAAHPSPNAGRIEAAFAGALGVQLGGPLAYGDRVEVRPTLGDGNLPGVRDIRRATRLSLIVSTAAALGCAAVRNVVVNVRGQ
jgi:adenosylcobinamide-phosphate synthase